MLKQIFSYETPIGKISIADNGAAITDVFFTEENLFNHNDFDIIKETDLIKEAGKQLKEYFAGKRKVFELPLAPEGTPFQKKVWQALQEIPYGETRTYKEIAQAIGQEKACRAVGMANNKNPIAIFIPCHRVIGSNGTLVGYAGGLEVKKYLLDLEKKHNSFEMDR